MDSRFRGPGRLLPEAPQEIECLGITIVLEWMPGSRSGWHSDVTAPAPLSTSVRLERMRVLVHVVVCYLILGLAFVHSTLYLEMATRLSLISPVVSVVLHYCPLELMFLYALIAFITRKSHSLLALVGWGVGLVVLAFAGAYYPEWLVSGHSQKIEISSFLRGNDTFLRDDEVQRFERAFGTPTFQYSTSGGGPWLVVRRDRYSSSMNDFLIGEAQRGAEPRGLSQ